MVFLKPLVRQRRPRRMYSHPCSPPCQRRGIPAPAQKPRCLTTSLITPDPTATGTDASSASTSRRLLARSTVGFSRGLPGSTCARTVTPAACSDACTAAPAAAHVVSSAMMQAGPSPNCPPKQRPGLASTPRPTSTSATVADFATAPCDQLCCAHTATPPDEQRHTIAAEKMQAVGRGRSAPTSSPWFSGVSPSARTTICPPRCAHIKIGITPQRLAQGDGPTEIARARRHQPICSGRIPSRTAPGTGAAVPITASPQVMRPTRHADVQEIHAWRTDEPRDKFGEGGRWYRSIGVPTCSIRPAFSTHDLVGHSHRLDLIMGDVNHRGL